MNNLPAFKKCKVWWCSDNHYANGYCEAHYKAYYRFGSPYGARVAEFELVDFLTSKARLLARDVLGCDWLFQEECTFCKVVNGKHKQNCVMTTAQNILDITGCNDAQAQDQDQAQAQDKNQELNYDGYAAFTDTLKALQLLVDRHDEQMLTKPDWDNARLTIRRSIHWSKTHG